MKEVLALIGPILTILAMVPYMIDVVRGKTKPNVVSWSTWTLITLIAGFATLSAGEFFSALLIFSNSVGTGTIVLLGAKYGYAKFSRFDAFAQIAALIALTIWLISDQPLVALVGAVFIDFLAVLPTIRHSWVSPQEETWQTFLITAVAPVFTFLSLDEFNLENMLYPTYLLLADAIVVVIILYRRKRKRIPIFGEKGPQKTLHTDN